VGIKEERELTEKIDEAKKGNYILKSLDFD
jgi:hypothetical protein